MVRRLITYGVVIAAALCVIGTGSAAKTAAICKTPGKNPYANYCVYFTGGMEQSHGDYVVTLHFLNTSSKAINDQVNAYIRASLDLDPVASHAPAKIESPVKYVMTSDSFTTLARAIGLPGGLKAHQDIPLRLTYKSVKLPAQAEPGWLFQAQFWIGPLQPKGNVNAGVNGFSPTIAT